MTKRSSLFSLFIYSVIEEDKLLFQPGSYTKNLSITIEELDVLAVFYEPLNCHKTVQVKDVLTQKGKDVAEEQHTKETSLSSLQFPIALVVFVLATVTGPLSLPIKSIQWTAVTSLCGVCQSSNELDINFILTLTQLTPTMNHESLSVPHTF